MPRSAPRRNKTTYDVGQRGGGESAWEATQSNGRFERNLAFHAICPNVLVLERFTPYYRAASVRTLGPQYGKKAKLTLDYHGERGYRIKEKQTVRKEDKADP